MKSTRDRILQTLLNHPRATIAEMAEAVGINAISVRHHLTSLEADGLVTAEEERHGVGRPRLVYFLTAKGNEIFPTNYLGLTNRLLDQLKETIPANIVNKLFEDIAIDLAKKYAPQDSISTLESRLEYTRQVLSEEGFTLEWERQGDQYTVHAVTCPYHYISQAHPEVCAIDRTLISKILAVPAEQIQCTHEGDNHCVFCLNTSSEA
ncbi:MAG TPA: winged helix-turn-helix transcriptional regulator [Anaerolineaceae bacterium]|nr:winged helix-turn-helix transcriptional regulator [Anaerolineaceae bacterium]HPN53597.1 winged helix-turn-helix transcriptional regulator [Anaerolineaceae bacterium]